MRTINIESYNRYVAVLIYKGKLYESIDNHQYALEEALKDNGDRIENHIEDLWEQDSNTSFVERNIDGCIDYTWSKTQSNELFTFSNFADKYLIGHTKACLDLNKKVIEEYAEKNNLILGYFPDKGNKSSKHLAIIS